MKADYLVAAVVMASCVLAAFGDSIVSSAIESGASSSSSSSASNMPISSCVIEAAREDVLALIDAQGPTLMPPLVRLAFHDCVGGCDGCVDLTDPENNGLDWPIDALADIVAKYDPLGLSRADVWALAAMTANENAQDPANAAVNREFPLAKTGRLTCKENDPKGGPHRVMPTGNGNYEFVKDFCVNTFALQTDRECTALLGAHTLGQALRNNSGFDGPWTLNPNCLDQRYYTALLRTDFIQLAVAGTGTVQWMFNRFTQTTTREKRQLTKFLLTGKGPAAPGRKMLDATGETLSFDDVMFLNIDISLAKKFELEDYDSSFVKEPSIVAPWYTGLLTKEFNDFEESDFFPFVQEFNNDVGVWLEEYERVYQIMIETRYPEDEEELIPVLQETC
mmetsp:Transcript_105/g.357  ORF Transcript_105/g.357 Transcript_105/m.357 type:complete len:393 (-) Transcript_105:444-1622(-)|eukprot:CAMPEP_0117674058 /NCGR_PEP_ID=MMETSP0804-20121206/14823_1 /TAXON_ID=1074897 /ORGANISM="Tetraselmis astigmatica, Strain CCMP880" /LENGTH=392 /DNA_ID=CAMNT_0005482877 /DNA_START=125 /DNA_END=1303 /DNA_ORIENTATION=-